MIFCCVGAVIVVIFISVFVSFIVGEMFGVIVLIGIGVVVIVIINIKNEIIVVILVGVVVIIGFSGIVYFLLGSKVKGLFLFLGLGVILGLGFILFF